jgi:hypothetical protein
VTTDSNPASRADELMALLDHALADVVRRAWPMVAPLV